jgi:hypothetical protein
MIGEGGFSMTQKTDPARSADALLRDPKRLRELLGAPETKRLMALLKSQNGPQLRAAAEAARQGDSSALSGMLHRLTGSQEGAAAMEGLESRLEGCSRPDTGPFKGGK